MSIMRIGYKKFGIGYALIVLSFVFLSFGIKEARTEDTYMSSAYVTVQALVTDRSDAPDDGMSALTLSYSDLSGTEYSRKMIYSGDAQAGDVIEIKMNTYNPQIIGEVKDFEEMVSQHTPKTKKSAVIEIAVGVIMLTAGIFLLVRRIRRDRLMRQLEE